MADNAGEPVQPQLNEALDTFVVVDNVPEIPAEKASKIPKLEGVLKKIFGNFGKIVDLHMALGDDGAALGYCFIEFATKEEAESAADRGDGYALDKKHKLSVILLPKFDEIVDTPDEWVEPPQRELTDEDNLQSWLLNADCEDQYVVRAGFQTTLFWNKREDAILETDRKNFTETTVLWSPKGSYMATFHGRGVALWGGPELKRVAKFSHPGVERIDFSPDERYLVTFSRKAPDTEKGPQAVIIWDIKTQLQKRAFSSEKMRSWPMFKWSHDDKYFALLGKDAISVFQTPSMAMLNKKSIKIKDIQDFQWSPSDNIISYWVPEEENKPAKVVLMAIPSREELTVKNLYSVKDCKMHWQEQGDYLCVKVDRVTKSKKRQYTNFELFHMREKLIPCDALEMQDQIAAFAWEPNGNKFAVIHGESPRICVSIYQLGDKAGKVNLLSTFDKMPSNTLFWSPRGQYLVAAGLYDPAGHNSMQGALNFIDTTGDCTTTYAAEHMFATDVEWDPTGRYVITSVSYWKYQGDNGYYVWGFLGRLLQKYSVEKFYMLSWRTRPKTLLSPAEQKKIAKNYKKYQSRFEAQDKLKESKASAELIEKRRKMADEWAAYRAARLAARNQLSEQLRQLRPVTEDENVHEEEEVIEFFVKEEEEIVDKVDV